MVCILSSEHYSTKERVDTRVETTCRIRNIYDVTSRNPLSNSYADKILLHGAIQHMLFLYLGNPSLIEIFEKLGCK